MTKHTYAIALTCALLTTMSVSADSDSQKNRRCASGPAQDLTPEVSARIASADEVKQVTPIEVYYPRDGVKISTAVFKARDANGEIFMARTTCTLTCTGLSCLLTGCKLDGAECSAYSCSGSQCESGSCTSVSTPSIE